MHPLQVSPQVLWDIWRISKVHNFELPNVSFCIRLTFTFWSGFIKIHIKYFWYVFFLFSAFPLRPLLSNHINLDPVLICLPQKSSICFISGYWDLFIFQEWMLSEDIHTENWYYIGNHPNLSYFRGWFLLRPLHPPAFIHYFPSPFFPYNTCFQFECLP